MLNHGDLAVCQSLSEYWARKFVLSDFGITKNEEFIIDIGSFGLSGYGYFTKFTFSIYKIDSNFPTSFSETDLIGKSKAIEISTLTDTDDEPKIFTFNFENQIAIPADVEIILIEVHQHQDELYGAGEPFFARTLKDNDDSWYKGCASSTIDKYSKINEIFPSSGKDINFYITVSGNTKTITPFEITNNNSCINFSNDFSLTNESEVKSVTWNFDDPSSGIDNTSTNIDFSHQFSSSGI
jgi:hypothetical protein